MKEVKPICFIQYNYESLNYGNERKVTVYEMNKVMSEKFPDYNVLCFPELNLSTNIQMQVFHPKDFTEIQFKELKDMVMKEIDNLKK